VEIVKQYDQSHSAVVIVPSHTVWHANGLFTLGLTDILSNNLVLSSLATVMDVAQFRMSIYRDKPLRIFKQKCACRFLHLSMWNIVTECSDGKIKINFRSYPAPTCISTDLSGTPTMLWHVSTSQLDKRWCGNMPSVGSSRPYGSAVYIENS
jgi:hypothetical protein